MKCKTGKPNLFDFYFKLAKQIFFCSQILPCNWKHIGGYIVVKSFAHPVELHHASIISIHPSYQTTGCSKCPSFRFVSRSFVYEAATNDKWSGNEWQTERQRTAYEKQKDGKRDGNEPQTTRQTNGNKRQICHSLPLRLPFFCCSFAVCCRSFAVRCRLVCSLFCCSLLSCLLLFLPFVTASFDRWLPLRCRVVCRSLPRCLTLVAASFAVRCRSLHKWAANEAERGGTRNDRGSVLLLMEWTCTAVLLAGRKV